MSRYIRYPRIDEGIIRVNKFGVLTPYQTPSTGEGKDMSSIMRRRNGLIASSVMGMLLS